MPFKLLNRLTHTQAVLLMVAVTLMWSIAGVVSRQLESAARFEVTFWRSAFTALSLLIILPVWRAASRQGRVQPIDPQANGPQLFYGLRYHLHVNTREEDISFHDQVGYWLYEPATGLILQTLAIPRGQIAIAAGHAAPDAKQLVVKAERGQAVEVPTEIGHVQPAAESERGSQEARSARRLSFEITSTMG